MSCRSESAAALCDSCLHSLRPAADRRVGRVLVRSAFEHVGAARSLVHRLKYDAVWGVADRLAAAMSPLVPSHASVLVPVPRVTTRRHRYGIDPAQALAVSLGRRIGLPVARLLRPRWWSPRRAGPSGARRGVPQYRAVGRAVNGAVLVDDVVTSGTTLAAAAAVLEARNAVTATAGHSPAPVRRGPPYNGT